MIRRSIVEIISNDDPKANNRVNKGRYCDEDYDVEFQAQKRGRLEGLITYKRTDGSFLSFNLVLSKKQQVFRKVSNVEPDNISVMEINHVFVPEISRGLKIAEFLTIKAFSIAELNDWGVIPTCSYVRDTFLKRRPEFRVQLVPELSTEINRGTETSSTMTNDTDAETLTVDCIKKRKRSSTEVQKTGL
jgi:predicted GNAT family acetyltransferase